VGKDQIQKPAPRERTEAPATQEPKDLAPVGEEIKDKADEVKDEIDKALEENQGDLIDEIDEVLEQNAEEFVKNYVQRGGE
jgi:ubiquitin-like protein Pup